MLICVLSIFVFFSVGKGLVMGRSPDKGILLNVFQQDSENQEPGDLGSHWSAASYKKMRRWDLIKTHKYSPTLVSAYEPGARNAYKQINPEHIGSEIRANRQVLRRVYRLKQSLRNL